MSYSNNKRQVIKKKIFNKNLEIVKKLNDISRTERLPLKNHIEKYNNTKRKLKMNKNINKIAWKKLVIIRNHSCSCNKADNVLIKSFKY